MELDWFTTISTVRDANPEQEQEEIFCVAWPEPDYRLNGTIRRDGQNGRPFTVRLTARQGPLGHGYREATVLSETCCFWSEAVSMLKTAMEQHEDPATVSNWRAA